MLIQSMSDKVRSNAALTTEEKNLLGVASIPLYKVVAVQAASSFNLSPGELNSLAEVTAIDLLNSIVQRMLDQVATGQSNNINQAAFENLRQFNKQHARVRQRGPKRHTPELQPPRRIPYAAFCCTKKR